MRLLIISCPIWICTVCSSVVNFWLKPLFATMDLTKFEESISYSGVKGLNFKGLNIAVQGPIIQIIVLNELVNDKLVNCYSWGIFKYIDIFAAKMWVAFAMQKLLTFFSKTYIHNIFRDRKFNVTLANNFVKFWITGPRTSLIWQSCPLINDPFQINNFKPTICLFFILFIYLFFYFFYLFIFF